MPHPHPDARPEPSPALDPVAALHALADGYLVVAADWRILFANRAFQRILGLDLAEFVGLDLWEVLGPLRDLPEAAWLRATMMDRVPRDFRIDYGDARIQGTFDVRATSAREGALCIQFRDISEATRFGRELGERNEENESLRELARALAGEIDSDALLRLICTEAVSHCHAAAATVAQVRDDHVVIVAGAGIGEAGIGRSIHLAGSLTERAIRQRAVMHSEDYPAEYPRYGAELDALSIGPALVAPLIAHNEVLGVVMAGRLRGAPAFAERDVRRIRAIADHAALALWKARLFEDVRVANRTKSEFMATMSHELRTPLTALTGYEELLSDEVLGPLSQAQHGALDRMRASTEILSSIIEEILSFSRLEAGHETAKPQESTVEEIVSAASAVIAPLASHKGLALGVSTPQPETRVFTDVDMARRILVNLGANAVKFTDSGSIAIEAAASGDELSLAVRDTGIGIASDDIPRLFQPFTQLDSGFTRRHGGTGLGLYISKRLALLLGGRIDVESDLGKGSVFTVVLPRELSARDHPVPAER